MSLMGLVLVKKPFYNEAGFEGYEGEGSYQVESALYSEKAYVMARGFVRYALCNSVRGLEDCLAWLYLSKAGARGVGEVPADDAVGVGEGKGKERELARPELLEKLMRRAMTLMEYSSSCARDERDELVDGAGGKNAEAFMRPLSQGAVVMLRRHLDVLQKAFHIHV